MGEADAARPDRRLVLASTNPGKLRELSALLAGLRLRVIGPADAGPLPAVEETGETFRANAELKARAVAAATDCWALADDSGLEVDALDGAPGVRSARFAGERADDAANNARLLALLAEPPHAPRTARFRCVAVVAAPDGTILAAAEGMTEGQVLEAPRGTAGFGYDPLFLSTDLGVPFGEASLEAKNRVSHRGRAMAQIREALRRLLPP